MSLLGSHTDAELVLLLKSGSEPAFTELYRRHWQTVYRNAMRVLRSAADAEDIIQQTFESIWKRREQLDIQKSFEAYLFAVSRYLSIAVIEKDVDRHQNILNLAERLEPAVTPIVESSLDARELEVAITRIVETLPPKMRDIFLLSRNEALTHKQIAERLQITEATVKKQVYYALKIIREQLGDSLPVILALVALYLMPE